MSRRDIALLWNAWLAALPPASKRRITRARERAHSSTCEKSKPNRPKYQQYFGIGGSTARMAVPRAASRWRSQRLPKILDRLLDTFVELNSWFPTEDFFRTGDV